MIPISFSTATPSDYRVVKAEVLMVRCGVVPAMGLATALACSGCAIFEAGNPLPRDTGEEKLTFAGPAEAAGSPPPLPLRVPLRGVMAGIVDLSAVEVFEAATSETDLSSEEWLGAGLAAINLVAAASLITLPGSGPHDAARVAEPDYRALAEAMQAAAIDAGVAVVRKDRTALLDAADRLAGACQSCHALYRLDPPSSLSQFASRW